MCIIALTPFCTNSESATNKEAKFLAKTLVIFFHPEKKIKIEARQKLVRFFQLNIGLISSRDREEEELRNTVRHNRSTFINSTFFFLSFFQVLASDRDLGFNGDLLYVISEGNLDSSFDLDTTTGDLKVSGYLDRERTSEYMLNLTVYDQGIPQKSASRLLHVILEDENDNPPTFFKSTFSFFFPENTRKGTPVVSLNATDLDSGLNGQITYYLDTETDAFSLNPISGLLVVSKELDRETKEFYDLTIRAVDGSLTNPLSSTAVVRVRVLDVNDVAPLFTARQYFVKAREDLPVGTVVGMVHAHDADLYQGGQVRFSLEPNPNDLTGMEHFMIDEISGTLRVKHKLDYEQKQLYNLTVKASDEGSPSLSSLASFVLEILDVNENHHPPRFDSFFLRTAVPENMPIGSHVATVTAKDFDDPESDDSRISYSLRGGDGLGSFYIDNEGNIKTLAALDRESKAHYWLTVHAQDHGAVPLSSKLFVYVQVLNVNDNIPMTLEPVYYPSVQENSKPFSRVVTIKATDADLDPDTKLTFSIVAGNPQSLFHIDPNTGIISTTKRILDRETQSEHVLEVLVNDNGKPALNSTTRVVVSVQDVNDNPPEFLERYYKLSVPETRAVAITQVQNDQESVSASTHPGVNGSSVNETEALLVEDRQWEELFLNASWDAGESMGKPLFRSIARDADQGENGQLAYDMKSSGGKFQIDPSTGIVYLTEGSSLEAGDSFEMLVRAKDRDGDTESSLTALSRIFMTVKSLNTVPNLVNAEPPTVLDTPTATVFETDKIGHLVSLVMASDPEGDQLWYSIIAGDEENQFYMSPDRGSILLAKKLAWESKRFYNLTVSVSDGKFNTLNYVGVKVIDVNEKRPEFVVEGRSGTSEENNAYFEIDAAENIPLGSKLVKLNITDGDRNPKRKVSFSFHAAQDASSLAKFKIHPTEGVVKVKAKLDRERTSRHVLTVAVKDQGSPAKANYARLVINVHDHNDHTPEFLSELIQTKLHETVDIGTEVLQVLAVDTDQGENGRISYSIASGNIGNAFFIEEDLGIIRVARELNMVNQGEYMLIVRATDHGIVPQFATVPVHILLTMPNDAAPRFMKPHYATEVYENQPRGHFILQVEARSRSALRYEIIAGNEADDMFAINPSTGIIMTQRFLDFEMTRFYNLTVQVSNMIGVKAECTVNVHVLDVNDNEPRFEKRLFSGHVSETASIGSLILLQNHSPLVIKATDADTGVNSLLFYEILDEKAKKFFAIDESTGAIRTTMSLDYEEQSSFDFNVRVSDRGKPKLSSEALAKVNIEILDENDSPPRFDHREYRQVLLLPTFKDVSILTVNASDPDSGENTKLRYSIVGGNEENRFRMDSDEGKILVAMEEEIGESSQYAIDISVTDGKYSDRAVVYLSVEKSDNSGLAFAQKKYHATVLENSTKKSDVIEVVTVLGAALNENLHFSLLNPTDMFLIGPTSGAIRTSGKAFDREVKDRYELVVEVRSSDHSRIVPRVAHVIVDVEVLDINDNAPMFINQPYHAVMSKETEKDHSVMKVSAIDMDKGTNGDIYYQLVKGNGELFRVGRKSGQITLRQKLDSYRKEYRLTLAAYDGGLPPLSAEISVHIKVIDESVPIFSQQLYKASVKEDIELYSPVVSVEAESPDEGKLIFTLEAGNEEEKFSVDYNSGMISVTEPLDFESKPHHQLTIRATDGLNGGYAEAIVLLGVEDVNDCRPQFINDSYSASLSEAMPYGTNVLQVKATDADSGINQQIEYSIQRDHFLTANASKLFSIDAQSGWISLKRQLDHERVRQHRFTVMATDKGSRQLSASAMVTVNVLDTNDNAPEFDEAEYIMTLSDRASRGQFVGKVRAIDPDEDDKNKLKYAIIGGNQHQIFSMNEQNGVITLVNLHNFDQSSVYLLNISVSDGVYARNSKVRITLASANSFAPTFSQDLFEVDFYENQPEGSLIAQLTAKDEDRNDRLEYSILSDDLESCFRMDASTGQIWALKSFDREEKSEYEIPIRALDIGGRNGFTVLKVRITDVNDNRPGFALSEYRSNIHANLTVGSPVIQVMAVDKDSGENARLSYSIYENGTSKVSQVFQIDSQSGLITLKKGALKLENQIYQFFVRAQDSGREQSLHSDVPIEVYIMSPLDRAPIFEQRDSVYYISENSPVGRVIAQMKASRSAAELDRRRRRQQDEEEMDWEEEEEIRYKIASSEYAVIEEGEEELDDNEDDDVEENNRRGEKRGRKSLNGLFQIDDQGRLIVNGHLDREDKAIHKLTLLAQTETSPVLSAYYDITIQILDENDNPPTFQSNPYHVVVSESVPPHTSLVQAVATDKDFGNNGEVRYSFGKHSQDLWASKFNVDTHSGWITTQDNLDFEQEKEYELEIVAIDNGSPSLQTSTTVKVKVIDANDNPTVFSQRHYTAAVNEGALPGTIIFQLDTEDKDENGGGGESDSAVEFFIVSGDPLGQFQVSGFVIRCLPIYRVCVLYSTFALLFCNLPFQKEKKSDYLKLRYVWFTDCPAA